MHSYFGGVHADFVKKRLVLYTAPEETNKSLSSTISTPILNAQQIQDVRSKHVVPASPAMYVECSDLHYARASEDIILEPGVTHILSKCSIQGLNTRYSDDYFAYVQPVCRPHELAGSENIFEEGFYGKNPATGARQLDVPESNDQKRILANIVGACQVQDTMSKPDSIHVTVENTTPQTQLLKKDSIIGVVSFVKDTNIPTVKEHEKWRRNINEQLASTPASTKRIIGTTTVDLVVLWMNFMII